MRELSETIRCLRCGHLNNRKDMLIEIDSLENITSGVMTEERIVIQYFCTKCKKLANQITEKLIEEEEKLCHT